MRLATVDIAGRRVCAVVEKGTVRPLAEVGSLLELIERSGGRPSEVRTTGEEFALDEVQFEPPLEARNIFCVGWNYLRHFEEGAGRRNEELPEHPAFFSKATGTLLGHGRPIPSHRGVTESLDYEAELTVVIGRPGRDIPMERALDHVFGYTVGNDISARDLQRRHGGQWLKGKSLDGSCPLGPWVVTADEVGNPQGLRVSCRVNGQVRQDSPTAAMIFPVAELISRLSEGMTLRPGDILLTGTPEGVGMGMDPPTYLRPGDVVECEVSGIGVLRNSVGH